MSKIYSASLFSRPRPGLNSPPRVVHAARQSAAADIGQRSTEVPQRVSPAPEHSGFKPAIHEIPESAWEKGVPSVMGAHLMASGTVAPISTSKGTGDGVARHMFLYPDGEYECEVSVYASGKAAGEGVASMVLETARKAIAVKDSFTLVLSGGSLVNALKDLAGEEAEWDKWHVFWVDERVVPHSDSDSNYKGAKEAFLDSVPIPEGNVHAIAEGLNAEEAAKHYEGMLLGLGKGILPRLENGFPAFDTVLLGVGPDGHVASLFPNRAQTAATKGWVLHIDDSPKPPPSRITLTMPVINSAENVAIVALGEGKSEIIQRCLEHQALPGALPAQLVRPTDGKLVWILDSGSSKDLKINEWDARKSFPTSEIS